MTLVVVWHTAHSMTARRGLICLTLCLKHSWQNVCRHLSILACTNPRKHILHDRKSSLTTSLKADIDCDGVEADTGWGTVPSGDTGWLGVAAGDLGVVDAEAGLAVIVVLRSPERLLALVGLASLVSRLARLTASREDTVSAVDFILCLLLPGCLFSEVLDWSMIYPSIHSHFFLHDTLLFIDHLSVVMTKSLLIFSGFMLVNLVTSMCSFLKINVIWTDES